MTIDAPPPYPQTFSELVTEQGIRTEFQPHLKELYGHVLVIILDDSGSMSACLRGKRETYYHEAIKRCEQLKKYADAASIPIHIYPMNQEKLSPAGEGDFKRLLERGPGGSTPTLVTIQKAVKDFGNQDIIFYVMTDGEADDMNGLWRFMRTKPDCYKFTFALCTEKEESVKNYRKWDLVIPFTDVIDDYESEVALMKRHCGQNFVYSIGDYNTASLLGSFVDEIDKWNETMRGEKMYTDKEIKQILKDLDKFFLYSSGCGCVIM